MKNLQFILAAFVIASSLSTNAQVAINVSLGARPQWHNESRCENNTNYYYLPEIEAYYDVTSATFIYNGSRGWVRAAYLPEYYGNYDVNRGLKVALSYRGRSPYVNFEYDRDRYYRNNRRDDYGRRHDNRRNDYVVYNSGRRHYDEGNRWDYKRNHHEHEGHDRD